MKLLIASFFFLSSSAAVAAASDVGNGNTISNGNGLQSSSLTTPWQALGAKFPKPFPTIRYTPWNLLPFGVREYAKDRLDYNEATWNLPGTNPIEDLSWSSLTIEQQTGAKQLGFSSYDTWDCWQNHYGDYSWEEMVDEEVDEYYEDLGYNSTSWDRDLFVPIEDDYWVEMDDDNDDEEDKKALNALCYFEETWDAALPIFISRMDNSLGQVDADSCGDEEYEMHISFFNAHLFNIMTPASSNTNPLCQDSILLHDHGGTKAAFNATDVPMSVWTTTEPVHMGTSTWEEISSSFSLVNGFGNRTEYDFMDNNCIVLTLQLYGYLGIVLENNVTIIEYATNHLFSLPIARSFVEQQGLVSTFTPDIVFKQVIQEFVKNYLTTYYASQK